MDLGEPNTTMAECDAVPPRAALRWYAPVVAVCWLAAVATGFVGLALYAFKPGSTGTAPVSWPAGTAISADEGRPTLVMFVHPKCPCSRASVAELERLMAVCDGRVSARVVFLRPAGFDDEWAKTDIWQSAAAIPSVTVLVDRDAVEARRFDAETSGQTFLFDASGRLLFSGGITGARGHEGDNAGLDAVASLIVTGRAERSTAPVFGCSLFDAPDSGAEGAK
jgi:hypothetical protein